MFPRPSKPLSLDDAADIGVAPPMTPILNQSERKANDPKVLWVRSTRFRRKHWRLNQHPDE